MQLNTIYNMDCLEGLKLIPDGSINTCVTSPPYWGLRDYGVDGQIGLEITPEEYISKIVDVFREVRRVLRDDGTLWINLGDSYAGSCKGFADDPKRKSLSNRNNGKLPGYTPVPDNLKPKDLVGIPWRVAFALQDDGWYLRSDIIWHKPNPMPESVTDRPTKAHEYIFLLTKSERYYYNHEAIKEDCSPSTHMRISQDLARQVGSYRANGGGKTNGPMKAVVSGSTRKIADAGSGIKMNKSFESALSLRVEKRNKRTVWTVATKPFTEAHFATFPPDLIKPCILAGCPEGDIVYDPFMGAGTTAVVAYQLGRNYLGTELNAGYCNIAEKRIESERYKKESLGIPLFGS